MERFQLLIKKKIAKRLAEGEAKELQGLLEKNEDCRSIFQTIFLKPVDYTATGTDAEEAFALHFTRMQKAETAETKT